jgi:hypothetical protein
MMIKVILENTDEFRWVSVAMAKKKVRHGEVVLDVPDFDDADVLGGGAATEPPHLLARFRASRKQRKQLK